MSLRERFGAEISRRVEALTEDRSIAKYRSRKAALRHQVLGADAEVATVSLADKAAKLRARETRPASSITTAQLWMTS